jgi:murein hydrolase activator
MYKRHKTIDCALAAALAACLAGIAVGPVAAQPRAEAETFVERLHQKELQVERLRQLADEVADELEASERRVHRGGVSAETADRAQRRVRRKLADRFVAWERADRRLERAVRYMPPGEAADTAVLLASAESRAHAAQLDDIDVYQSIEADTRRTRQLVGERAGLVVELAQSEAKADTSEAERDEVVDEANRPENKKERDRQLEQSDEALGNSIGMLLKNETPRDFHRLKGTLLPPVSAEVTHGFGPRKQDSSMSYVRHTGLTWMVDEQTPVKAVASGLVVYAGRFEGFGKMVIVDHGQEYHSLYAHLAALEVEVGDTLARGGLVGESGSTGSFEGPKLYFELRKDGNPINPTPWLIQR